MAQQVLTAGNYLWNDGIFLFSVKIILSAFRQHASQLIEPIQRAVDAGKPDLGFFRLDPEAWAKAQDISIDYAFMERAKNLSVVPFSADWSDLGG